MVTGNVLMQIEHTILYSSLRYFVVFLVKKLFV